MIGLTLILMVQEGDKASMTTSSATKVLIVDDNAFNREGIGLYLSREGFDVLEAGDAEATKRMVRTHCPDVTVLDIQTTTNFGFEAKNSNKIFRTGLNIAQIN